MWKIIQKNALGNKRLTFSSQNQFRFGFLKKGLGNSNFIQS